MYSSNLTTHSQTYSRDGNETNYYYEAIQVSIIEDGNYTLGSNSHIDTYGYIYKDKFNPRDPSTNQVAKDNNGGCNDQFKLFTYLQTKTTYILVVTTYHPNEDGPFSIFGFGPNNIILKYRSEYI